MLHLLLKSAVVFPPFPSPHAVVGVGDVSVVAVSVPAAVVPSAVVAALPSSAVVAAVFHYDVLTSSQFEARTNYE